MHSKGSSLEELSDDLIAEILRRVPLRFLLQCTPVNKRLLRVISDPTFIHPCFIHHQFLPLVFQKHTLFLLFCFISDSKHDDNQVQMLFSIDSNDKSRRLKGSNFFPHSWPQHRGTIRVEATHHDLVLCSTLNNCYINYFVCNPFTKQCVSLPPKLKSHENELACVGFILDQSRSRFRVVHIPIVCSRSVSSFQVNMFSSDTGEWDASNVPIPRNNEVLMTRTCSSNIIVYNGKLVLWLKRHGFLMCDPFNGSDSNWKITRMHSPIILDDNKEWDIYTGICNGKVKTCVFSRTNTFKVYELLNFEEEGSWYGFDSLTQVSFYDMNFLAFHPRCEYMIYIISKSKKGIFLCDYKNHKLKSVYLDDEDACASINVMSLVFPEWPTPVPTLNAAKS